MFKMSHRGLILVSAAIWLGVGLVLLPKGLNFITDAVINRPIVAVVPTRPLLNFVAAFSGGLDQAVIVLVALALWIGFLKGRFIFSKTVKRSVERILSLPNPSPLSSVYDKKYYILLGSMFVLGYLVRFAPLDIRGFVDVIIGSALIQGAVQYRRAAFQVKNEEVESSIVS